MNLILLRAQLRGLSAFRSLLDTPMLKDALQLLDAAARRDGEGALAAYDQMFYRLKAEGYSGLGTWLWDTLRYTETPYGDLAGSGRSDPELEGAARRDVDALLQLARLGAEDIRVALKPILTEEYVSVLDNLPAWETGAPFTFEELAAFYQENGAGLYAKYRAFLWEEGRLVPVADPDCPHPVELLGYDQQRKQVLDNTRLLVEGKPSNNVLLFGDGGTGKSATVKSMLYLPGMENLRLIEIQKENLVGMPRLIRSLAGRRQSFILFGLRPGRQDLLLSENHSGGRPGETPPECGHLRHLQPPPPGAADLLRPGGGRGGRLRDHLGKNRPSRALRPAHPLHDHEQIGVSGPHRPPGRPVPRGDGPGGPPRQGHGVGDPPRGADPPGGPAVHRKFKLTGELPCDKIQTDRRSV